MGSSSSPGSFPSECGWGWVSGCGGRSQAGQDMWSVSEVGVGWSVCVCVGGRDEGVWILGRN